MCHRSASRSSTCERSQPAEKIRVRITDELKIRAVNDRDRDWACSLLRERWGGPEVVTRGRLHQADQLPGFIALNGQQPVGLITYSFDYGDCEIVSLDSLESYKGIGSALVKAVLDVAFAKHCTRAWLITTNDNTGALRFYQKMGFGLVAVHREAIRKSREMKPGIPEKGCDGIPIRDEIELELRLQ
jgi:GNAT superfamily N-acetyltransferase